MAASYLQTEKPWVGAVRERRRALLQRVGMGCACALIFSPVLGWTFTLAWAAAYLLVQVLELSAFWPVADKGRNGLPRWRLAVGTLAVSLNAASFSSLSIPLWLYGGAMGGICAAIIVCSGAVYAIVTSPRSPLVLGAALTPQMAYMAVIPMMMTAWGSDGTFVMATTIALMVYAAYCLNTWARMNRASQAEASARLEAEARRKEAERAMDARSAFLAAVGHDLRTPLSAILTGAMELERDAQSAASRSNAALIGQAGLMMKSLLDDLLDHAKLDAGRMTISEEDFNLRSCLAKTLRLWQRAAAAKGLKLRVEGASEAPAWVRGDETRLRQILNNLISNAVKFTGEGSITLRIRSWAEEPRGHAIVIEVADTGPGMDKAQLARLFEPFDQTEDGVSARHGGTGLGLAISRDLAELMGGRLTVRSAKGEGATFTLSLRLEPAERRRDEMARPDDTSRGLITRALAGSVTPPARPTIELAEPAPEETAPEPVEVIEAAEEPSAEEAPSPLKVLVVDDHDINRRAVQLILGAIDCEIEMAADGMAALQACARQAFDVIFMDVRMRELDGRETTRRLRASEGLNRATPVIAVTADTAPEDIDACMKAGMNYFVSKPLTPPALLGALQHVLMEAADGASAESAAA